MQKKQCTVCGLKKPFTLEYFSPTGPGKYLRNVCRPCHRAQQRAYFRNQTSEKRAARIAKVREWVVAHKTKVDAYQKKWKAENHRSRIEYNMDWRRRNPDLAKKYYDKTNRRKRMSPVYRMTESFASQIRTALKGKKDGLSWEKLVDFTRVELVDHLERRFEKGMSWANYGDWHVDHIKPISAFKFSSPNDPEFKACWALDNLQPLWALDNIRKGGMRYGQPNRARSTNAPHS